MRDLSAGTVSIAMPPGRLGSISSFLANNAIVNPLDLLAKGDGIRDDTVELRAALVAAAGAALFLPPNKSFRITGSLTIVGNNPITIYGVGSSSRIINNCPAGTPAIRCTAAQFFTLRDFAILGDIAFPNDAILIEKDGSGNRSGFFTIKNLFLVPNGVGIHMQDTNTAPIDDINYWPSGNNLGATATNALLTHAILADGAGAVNDIHVRRLNASNWATIAQGGSAIQWNTGTGSNSVTIAECELEGPNGNPVTDKAIDFTNVNGFALDADFVENSTLAFTSCAFGALDKCEGAADALYTLTGCQQVVAHSTTGNGFTVDATSVHSGARDSAFTGAVGYVNNGLLPVTQNVLTTGSLDTMGVKTLAVVAAAKTIYTVSLGIGLLIEVFGYDPANNNCFFDRLAYLDAGGAPAVISQTTVFGAPAARTYTAPTGLLIKLSMASGSYTVIVFPQEIR